MGSYTRFDIKVKLVKPEQDPLRSVLGEPCPRFAKWLCENSEYWQGIEVDEKTTLRELLGEEQKWYECEDDMKKMSKQFPAYAFTIKGEGEEPEDQWIHTFFRGKVHKAKAKITFESPPEKFFQ